MEYREFGRTGMRLSVIGTGGLLAHYWEGESGHPSTRREAADLSASSRSRDKPI